MITSAISSAVEARPFFTTSSVIGSARVSIDIDVHLDVAEGIEPRAAARRDDARGVVLVDEERPRALAVEQRGPRHDRHVQLLPEVRAADALLARQALDGRERVVPPRGHPLDARPPAPPRPPPPAAPPPPPPPPPGGGGGGAVPVRAEVLVDEVAHEQVDVDAPLRH